MAETAAKSLRILLADDETTFRESLAQFLREEGMEVTAVGNGSDARDALQRTTFDVFISDIKMPGLDGLTLLKTVQQQYSELDVVLITAYGSIDSAVEAMKLGAADYILKPLRFDDLIHKLHRLVQLRELRRENRKLRTEIEQRIGPDTIIGATPGIGTVLALVDKLAQTRSNVLILGESGTGKELIARAIHNRGITAAGAFVPVNCGGIPDALLESEMFGYRRGAFTGATRDKVGFFQAAHGGTLFLDEVGNLPMAAQMSLLRAIEEKAVTPLGDTKTIRFELRIVSATNRDLSVLVRAGTFREDLYFRLNVVRIDLPPLRERRDDIERLALHFIAKYNAEMKRGCPGLTPEALAALQRHIWKGNIRELENVIERALIFAEQRPIEVTDLPFAASGSSAAGDPVETSGLPAVPECLDDAVRILERYHLQQVLRRYGYDKGAAAAALGISVPSLYRKMRDLELPTQEGKDGH